MSATRLTAALAVVVSLAFAGIAWAADLTGTTGRDHIKGTQSADTINALAGNDEIHARGGDDTVNGGPGRDEERGGKGKDTLNGDDGRDNLDGNQGDDTLNGGANDDKLKDRRGANTFNGGEGDDRIDARDRGHERGQAASIDTVDCGPGDDEARVDSNDKVVNCEHVKTRKDSKKAKEKDDDSKGHGGPGRD
jgi:Ca2+-binding RTX toxin-like protein